VLRAGGSDVDGVGPVDDDVWAAVGQRHVLETDVEVGVGVPVWTGCDVEGGTVVGAVTVKAGGSLTLRDATVQGAVLATDATSVLACGSTVTSIATFSATNGPVDLGTPADGCGPDKIQGALAIVGGTGGITLQGSTMARLLTVTGNTGTVSIAANTIAGLVTVASNTSTGPAVISANTIRGALVCVANSPAPVDAGVPNTVSLLATGQCATLK
jgi:hypothetical protein